MKPTAKHLRGKTGGRGPSSLRDNRGIASVALFVFAVVSVLVLVANFQMNSAVSTTTDAYDTFSSQMVEKNGISQLVKESILALRETSIANSANSLQTEIQNRLSSTNFPSTVSVTIDPGSPVPNVAANPFFPTGTPAPISQPDYFSPVPTSPPLAGAGNLLSSLAFLGPVAHLQQISVSFDRTSTFSDGSPDPNDNRTYVVNADLFSVPLTNVDVVAYGMPISGSIPAASPAVPSGFFGSDVSCLVVSSDNPARDPTATSDLYAPTAVEQLPYQFRNGISFSWNAYEFLWSASYQNALLSASSTADTIYNFASPPAPPPLPAPQNKPFPWATINGNTLTIDCSGVPNTTQIITVVDPNGGDNVVLSNSSGGGSAFVLLVQGSAAARTNVTFSGSNSRPIIYYLENANLQFSGNPQIEGALFLDPNTRVAAGSGNVTWFGHLSFYGGLASPLVSLNGITMADSPPVKTALAALAPRVLLVSTNAIR